MPSKMNKTLVISCFPPLKDNFYAPNSLLYNLLLNKPYNSEITLLYYAQENVPKILLDKDLDTLKLSLIKELKPHIPKRPPLFNRFVNKLKPFILPPVIDNFIPSIEDLHQINNFNPDKIWLYPYWLINWAKKLNYPLVVSGMDSAALHNLRSLMTANWKNQHEFNHQLENYRLNVNLEKEWGKLNCNMHMVGKMDLRYYLDINNDKAKGFYSAHPHNDYVPLDTKISEKPGKLNLLVTGNPNSIYFGNHFESFINILLQNPDFSSHYSISLIGPNFEEYVLKLQEINYTISWFKRVDRFDIEISKSQIQIFPLAIGTGTKGKVLHAMATGLLGIGSNIAFENINVQHNRDCLIYDDVNEIKPILIDIIQNKDKYSKIAENGSLIVRSEHNPQKTSETFWKNLLKA